MNQTSAFSLYRLMKVQGIGPARMHSMFDISQNNGSALPIISSPDHWSHVLKPKEIESLQKTEEADGEEWKHLTELGVKIVTQWDNEYPSRLLRLLSKKAPPILFIRGNADLLQSNSAGFCGSRKASEKGLKTAEDCAEQLARKNINLVSGYAAGVDQAAHQTALKKGGTTTVVLPEGIFHFRIKKELRDFWDWSRVAIVSEFLPGRSWSVGNAMQRNSTICALSNVMLLIEARVKGGSIEAGKICLNLGIPLFAPIYEGMPDSASGNQLLLQQGAHSLKRSSITGKANIEPLIKRLKEGTKPGEENQEKSVQLNLFGSISGT